MIHNILKKYGKNYFFVFKANRKIKNAIPVTEDGIEFKSKLEWYCYKTCKEKGLILSYEPTKFVFLQSAKLSKVIIYSHSKTLKRLKLLPSVRELSYTPDFYLFYNNAHIYIDTKGYPNDAYPIKRKLFINLLENSNNDNLKIYFFEPSCRKEIDECINLIKNININENPVGENC